MLRSLSLRNPHEKQNQKNIPNCCSVWLCSIFGLFSLLIHAHTHTVERYIRPQTEQATSFHSLASLSPYLNQVPTWTHMPRAQSTHSRWSPTQAREMSVPKYFQTRFDRYCCQLAITLTCSNPANNSCILTVHSLSHTHTHAQTSFLVTDPPPMPRCGQPVVCTERHYRGTPNRIHFMHTRDLAPSHEIVVVIKTNVTPALFFVLSLPTSRKAHFSIKSRSICCK